MHFDFPPAAIRKYDPPPKILKLVNGTLANVFLVCRTGLKKFTNIRLRHCFSINLIFLKPCLALFIQILF